MKNFRKFLFLSISILIGGQLISQEIKYKFQDPSLSISERTEDLISRMTLEEKVSQLLDRSPAIERLGIPEYNWWNECLHGVARNGRATVFPQAIGMAATFDTDLIHRIGEAISMEARAKYNLAVKSGTVKRYQGLTFWTPNVNIFRDPRWGRGQETYGEDPFLTSRMGVSFVTGLQGSDGKYLKAAGLAKHYAVHNGPEELRHEFNAETNMKDMWETYLPAFEALVKEAKVEGVMGAYNRTNGDPCCAHPYLMQEVLRNEWGFGGYYVSDCGAITDFYRGHNIAEDAKEAAAIALNAGTNLNCGGTYRSLMQSIEAGLTDEATVNDNLRELLPTRFKLGILDPIGSVSFDTIGPGWIRHPEHVALSLEAAEKSLVLLKNKDNTLPVDPNVGGVFVTGPTATHVQSLLANYYGVSEDLKTILEGIIANTSPQTNVSYSQGALLDEPKRNPIDWFSGNAAEAEVTIACVGISQLIEGEEGESIMSRHKGDRVNIGLPDNQMDFLRNIRSKAKKLVVVITAGSAMAIPEVYEMADALIYAWYPGEQGGLAVGNVIFGKTNPSGKLPVTFVKSIDDLPPYEDYDMTNRTYRYMEVDPLFPFGFGLSYTDFEFSNLEIDKTAITSNENVQVTVDVQNTGDFFGEEVIQLYITDDEASTITPKHALKGFQRVALDPGEQKKISFILTPQAFSLVRDDGSSVVEPGSFTVSIGSSTPSKRSMELGAPKFLQRKLEVK